MAQTPTEKAIDEANIVRDREARAAAAIKAHLKVAPEKLRAGSGGYDELSIDIKRRGISANG